MPAEVNTPDALIASEQKLLACVHCGLCLEACPTYVHTGDENDGPRGRIYLMRAVEEKRLPVDSLTFRTHISRCLGCRACESACPAGVEYGHLLEAAQDDIASVVKTRGLTARLLNFSLRHVWLRPARLRLAFRLARAFRDTRLPRLLLKTKLTRLMPKRVALALSLLEASVPVSLNLDSKAGPAQSGVSSDSPLKKSNVAQADGGSAARVASLFTGCVMEGLFRRVNEATARVLKANGCTVSAPQSQVCCGALHAHAGDLDGARRLARQNVEAFGDGEGAIVTNAGGCGAMLASYAHLLADDAAYRERASAFSARVRDVSQQLQAVGLREGASLGGAVVTYDASCHLIHGQRAFTPPLEMLASIPGLRFESLEASDVCCGGAGVYNLLEEEMSQKILAEKLAHVRRTGAQILATGNPGCHMQIAAGARLAGLPLKVCHPVELLDESYRRGGVYEGEEDI